MPGPFLDLDEDDQLIAQAVLLRAQELDLERLELEASRLRAHAEHVGGHVARSTARLLASLLRR